MKTSAWLVNGLLVLGLGWAGLAKAQDPAVDIRIDPGVQLSFEAHPDVVTYVIDGARSTNGPWTALTNIPGPGSGRVDLALPLTDNDPGLYRVRGFDGSVPDSMVLIPAGDFVMGDTFGDGGSDELPLHTITISAFYMDRYEVTKALWDEVKAFNGGNGYTYSNTGRGKASNHPVHTVNWFDAVKWCNARSEMDGLAPVYYTDAGFTTVYKTGEIAPFANWSANGYRLPTEAEWEKAARGGVADQRFPWGDNITHSNANYYSWEGYDYDASSTRGYHPTFNDGNFPSTSPVGYFAPNGYGLYDMAGNVREWCWDWSGSSYYSSSPSIDPRGPSSGSYRVLRGGSWDYVAGLTRVAVRNDDYPDDEFNNFGFRCARGLGDDSSIPLPQTITFDPIGDQVVTSAVEVVASASSGLPVSLTVLSGPAQLSGSLLSFSATGTVSIVASQAGNSNWQAAAPVTNTFQVTAASEPPTAPSGMSLIPAGEFVMGDTFGGGHSDELPLHTNNISAFFMDQYEVTKALWDEVKAFNGGNGFSYSNNGEGKATNHPVHTVNWFDVVKWCNARSQMDGLTPVYYTDAGFTTVYKTGEIAPFVNWSANGYRLPMEAEWEKAARGGAANTRFPWTDYTNKISWAKANYYGRSNSSSYDLDGGGGAYHPTFATGGFPYTSPVGYFAPNGYGLYDMAGNVWEWCWDWYQGNYYASSPATDPRGPASGDFGTRVLRGGSCVIDAYYARVAFRGSFHPGDEVDDFGFRCARGL